MEDITNRDYMHGKRVCKGFAIKNLGEYYDLYLRSYVLLLADVLKTLEKCVETFINYILKIFFQLLE